MCLTSKPVKSPSEVKLKLGTCLSALLDQRQHTQLLLGQTFLALIEHLLSSPLLVLRPWCFCAFTFSPMSPILRCNKKAGDVVEDKEMS